MSQRKKLTAPAMLAALVAIVFIFTGASPGVTRAAVNFSGPVGLASGQAASLNFTNLHRRELTVELAFTDGEGRAIKSTTARVASGHSAVLILPYSELGDRTGRVQIAALASHTGANDSERSVATLEIFDESTGRTSFGLLLPAVQGFGLLLPA